MKSSVSEITPIIGTSMGGGFYAGRISVDGQTFALIVAPKADGEHGDVAWSEDYQDVLGAKSYFDGLANTKAMAEWFDAKFEGWCMAKRAALAAPQPELGATQEQIESLDDLVTMVRRLVRSLHKAAPTDHLCNLASDYLERKGFNKGLFRDAAAQPAPAAPVLSDEELLTVLGQIADDRLIGDDEGEKFIIRTGRSLLAKVKP
jgi:hypothetical protein